ncbi:MAG: MoaD/ThiS family protein [Actinomycetota bacterium]|nr:MoaD/ThiS family protein [Acidimicrobiales bacterium]
MSPTERYLLGAAIATANLIGMPTVNLRLFAGAREAAGIGTASFEVETLGDLMEEAVNKYGEGFSTILNASRVWVNGESVDMNTVLADGDEVAVLPPVSGGL